MASVIRGPYDPVERVVVESGKDGKTRQEFKRECDINTIMARAARTGEMPVNRNPGLYGDFSTVGDFQSAQELLKDATDQFNGLPSTVRERFRNNPVEMLAFVSDKNNREEAVKLGLVKPVAEPPGPVKVEVINAVSAGDPKPA